MGRGGEEGTWTGLKLVELDWAAGTGGLKLMMRLDRDRARGCDGDRVGRRAVVGRRTGGHHLDIKSNSTKLFTTHTPEFSSSSQVEYLCQLFV